MALQCLELFNRRKDILDKWQKRFTFIVIDEFQDICEAQYIVMRLLSGEQKNIMAVGDDDQSIYGFRGASPGIMRKFLEDFHAEQVILDKNYRSGEQIINASMHIIAENLNRMPKMIKAATDREGKVCLSVFWDNRQLSRATPARSSE